MHVRAQDVEAREELFSIEQGAAGRSTSEEDGEEEQGEKETHSEVGLAWWRSKELSGACIVVCRAE